MRIPASLMSILYLITFIVWLSLSLNGRRYSEAGLGIVLMVLSAIIYGSILSGINNAVTHEQIEMTIQA
jgi:hypothetical protein